MGRSLARGLGFGAAVAVVALAAAPAEAQSAGVVTGRVLVRASKLPLAGALVVATSPALPGEQRARTDAAGWFRLPALPPGVYSLRIEADGLAVHRQDGVRVRTGATVRVNAELFGSEVVPGPDVRAAAAAPSVDVGSATTGITLTSEFLDRLPLSPPDGRAAAARTYEAAGVVAPGARFDATGLAHGAAASTENRYRIDGIATHHPAFGYAATPLSLAFVDELAVRTGGYLPEHGRGFGALYDVTTKGGGPELHGSVSFGGAPGWLRDYVAEAGGPLVKGRVWMEAGVVAGLTRERLEACRPGVDCQALAAAPSRLAAATTIQYLAKLTYRVAEDHALVLSFFGAPMRSGGDGAFSIDPASGAADRPASGDLGHRRVADTNDLALRYTATLDGKRTILDVTAGWHHQYEALLAAGPAGLLEQRTLDDYQGRAMVTRVVRGAGQHVLKAGVDVEVEGDAHDHGPGSGVALQAHSSAIGGFAQESWRVADRVTLEAGVRYDAQILTAADGQTIAFLDQVSPRAGVVFDPTQRGKSRVFFHYARSFEAMPLALVEAPQAAPLRARPADELLLGGEYELLPAAWVGGTATHRWQGRLPSDAVTVRGYDAVSAYFSKVVGASWLAQASYTLSRLHGDVITPGFVLQEALLPGDQTHEVKLYVAKDITVPRGGEVRLGLAYRGHSGAPRDVRGETRDAWVHSLDLRVGYGVELAPRTALAVTVDVYNLLDLPVDGGAFLAGSGKPLAYQDGRQLRMSGRVTF